MTNPDVRPAVVMLRGVVRFRMISLRPTLILRDAPSVKKTAFIHRLSPPSV